MVNSVRARTRAECLRTGLRRSRTGLCISAHALNVCEPVSDAREPVSAFCAGKRFPGGGDGRC